MSKGRLGRLINALNKNEKSYFKRWLPNASKQTKTVQVFDAIEREPDIASKRLLSTLDKEFTAKKLNTISSHLYEKLLLSLRDYHRPSNRAIRINSRIDGIKVLQAKGLQNDALYEARKLLKECEETEMFPEVLRVIESIEAIYVALGHSPNETDEDWESLYKKKETVSLQLVEISRIRALERALLQINSRLGTASPDSSLVGQVEDLKDKVLTFGINDDSCFDVKFRYYQTLGTISRILLQHDMERHHFSKVLSVLDENPKMSSTYYQGFYAVALHNYANACILSENWKLVPDILDRLKIEPTINEATALRNFYFHSYDLLVYRTGTKEFENGYEDWIKIKKGLSNHMKLWDDGDIRLNLQAAVICFWNDQPTEALSILRALKRRIADPHLFPLMKMTDLLEIIFNLELEDDEHTVYLCNSFLRGLDDEEILASIESVTIKSISKILKDPAAEKSEWANLAVKLKDLCSTANQQHKLLTFDVLFYARKQLSN